MANNSTAFFSVANQKEDGVEKFWSPFEQEMYRQKVESKRDKKFEILVGSQPFEKTNFLEKEAWRV